MKRALAFDRSPTVRRTIIDHLSKLGFEVDQADSAAHGLAQIKKESYDLVVLDLAMPKMDELTLLRELRAASGDVPVVMFRSPNRPTMREAERLGVHSFISKPLRGDEFRAIIDRVLSRSRVEVPGHGTAESEDVVAAVVDYLGGTKVLRGSAVRTRSDVHDLIVRGLPAAALGHVVHGAQVLQPKEVSDAVGVSLRTVQRRRDTPRKPLSREQSDRAWQFAELMVRAIGIFGSRKEAERWFRSPAMALDQKRPIDLMTSSIGARMVEQLLTRIEYGVYT